MASVQGVSDRCAPWLTRVPAAGYGVCEICHVSVGDGWPRCFSCNAAASQVSRPIERVVPISLMPKAGQLYSDLKAYKGSYPSGAARTRIACIVGRFLNEHLHCLLEGRAGFDIITVVPSTRRTGRHPLGDVLCDLEYVRARYRDVLVATDTPPNHREARDDGYRTTEDVSGKAVLLLDDTLTTGARLQSAASTLALAGADVAAAVVVGRRFNHKYDSRTEQFWADLQQQGFDWSSCCLDSPPPKDPFAFNPWATG